MKIFPATTLLALTVVVAGCGGGVNSSSNLGRTTHPPGFVTADGTRFLDGNGRVLLLQGLNVVNKSKSQGYIGDIGLSDFQMIRSWGMNCIRLGIFWDGIEPEPGRFDANYLERVASVVENARQAGLYVLLDMHQDLYSIKFGDGAPAWATLDEGLPHVAGAVWSDAYYISPAVQKALDNFWANAPGPDGLGLQDRYAAAWQQVAERFKNEPAVLGYDLMNEPIPGKDAGQLLASMMARLAELINARRESPELTAAQLLQMQGTPEGRLQITRWLADLNLYEGMLQAGVHLSQDFDHSRLQPFYARVHKAIRKVDNRHIIFFEPAMSANLGVPTALLPLVDERGKRDTLQAYAPHGYDIVVDTSSLDLTSPDRVALIFRRHGEFAQKHQIPMLVGEWGAYYLDARAANAAAFVLQQFKRLGCGDIYWDYDRRLTNSPLLEVLRRGRPSP